MERVRFLDHAGKKVLFLDFTNCTPDDVMEIMDECKRIVTAQPHNSVLTLSDFSGGTFTRAAVQRMKEVAVYDRPHVRRAAIVGLESMPKALYKGLLDFSARDFLAFDSNEEALAWLVQEESDAA